MFTISRKNAILDRPIQPSLVDTDGKAESVTTVGNGPADVTQYVAGALFLTTCKPAVCQGTPCRIHRHRGGQMI